MNKVVSYSLSFLAAAMLLSWGASLIRASLPVLVPVGLLILGVVVYARIKKHQNQNRY
jgi:hypothetical protein